MDRYDLSIFSPASPPAESIRTLSVLVFVITGLIFLVVEGILIVLIVRSRRRATDDTKEPPQLYGSMPIEIAWTAAPALIVFVLTLVTARSLWEVNVDPPRPRAGSPALFVTAIGHQWWWEYRYESYDGKDLGFTTANELHVPVSESGVARPVYLTLKSADVCHSFWVPRLAGKTDLIPGRVNSMWFQAEEKGLFLGQCAEYCGTQHANMLLRVVVDSPEDFARWAEGQGRPAAEEPAAREGKAVFLSQSCVNCHRIRGTPARGTYAPDLTHLMSRDTLAAGMVPNTAEDLRRWIENPQAVKPGCLMPAFGLAARERDLLLDYLRTLR
ncbi:MAG TPA: cytochrome c oxidase subunit II [Isosphaeraceae bacterium]